MYKNVIQTEFTAMLQCKKFQPYRGIASSDYSIHYTNTNHNPYPGANPG